MGNGVKVSTNSSSRAAARTRSRDVRGVTSSSGCAACHNGEAVGGTSFQKMGIVEPYQTNNPVEGRIAVTGKDADRFTFKVPTLRNVELTYPYFHDGEAETLGQLAPDGRCRGRCGSRGTARGPGAGRRS